MVVIDRRSVVKGRATECWLKFPDRKEMNKFATHCDGMAIYGQTLRVETFVPAWVALKAVKKKYAKDLRKATGDKASTKMSCSMEALFLQEDGMFDLLWGS